MEVLDWVRPPALAKGVFSLALNGGCRGHKYRRKPGWAPALRASQGSIRRGRGQRGPDKARHCQEFRTQLRSRGFGSETSFVVSFHCITMYHNFQDVRYNRNNRGWRRNIKIRENKDMFSSPGLYLCQGFKHFSRFGGFACRQDELMCASVAPPSPCCVIPYLSALLGGGGGETTECLQQPRRRPMAFMSVLAG